MNFLIIRFLCRDFYYIDEPNDVGNIGKLEQINYPGDQFDVNYVYDYRGFLSEISSAVFAESYDYDDVGNLNYMEDLLNTASVDFAYDNLYRLTYVQDLGGYYDNSDLIYTYDNIGNRISGCLVDIIYFS